MIDSAADVASRIDPQLAAALSKVAEIGAGLGPPAPGPEGLRRNAALARKFWSEGGPVMAREEDKTIVGPLRDIPVVLYDATNSTVKRPVFVFLHGGGFRIGDAHANDRQMRELAAAWGGIVVSADYVHVPEHVFPAPVEETVAVLRWLAEKGGNWGVDGSRIAFGGLSAGANVALGAAVKCDGVRSGYLKAGVSIVGLLDDDNDTESMREFGSKVNPPREGVASTISDYVTTPAQRKDPCFNIALADPALFPPMFLAAAEIDSLRDSTKKLAARLSAAGGDHRMVIYPGMTHHFASLGRTVERAEACWRDVAAFLSEHLPAR